MEKIFHSPALLLFIMLMGSSSYAQESLILQGQVEAKSLDIEKIHIINLNQEKGSVTNEDGYFQIIAKENDSLYVSSVQFENKTLVVSKEMIERGSLKILLEDKMNELAEVRIDDIKLSGYLINDLKKISITEVETKNRLQNNLNEFIEKDKKLNPYTQPNPVGGIRVDKIAGAVIDKLSGNSETSRSYTAKELVNKSIAIVGQEFFREDLELNDNEVCNFLYFCTEDPRFKHLVINNNAFVLIEYFQTQIGDFKERRGPALNTTREIPG